MKKLNILYKEDNKKYSNNVRIYINDKKYGSLNENGMLTIELEPGRYNIKICYSDIVDDEIDDVNAMQEVWGEEIIQIEDSDLYYIFKQPFLVSQKGKLYRVSNEKFSKIFRKKQFWSSKTGILISIIIAIIIMSVFKALWN